LSSEDNVENIKRPNLLANSLILPPTVRPARQSRAYQDRPRYGRLARPCLFVAVTHKAKAEKAKAEKAKEMETEETED